MKQSFTMKTRIFSLILSLTLAFAPSIGFTQNSEEQTSVKGVFVKRGDGTFLHVEMVGVRMMFNVLDEDFNELEEPCDVKIDDINATVEIV